MWATLEEDIGEGFRLVPFVTVYDLILKVLLKKAILYYNKFKLKNKTETGEEIGKDVGWTGGWIGVNFGWIGAGFFGPAEGFLTRLCRILGFLFFGVIFFGAGGRIDCLIMSDSSTSSTLKVLKFCSDKE